MKRLLPVIGALLLLLGVAISTTSCEKDTRDYELTVVITTYDSVRVQNANVHLFAPVSNSIIDYWYTTDDKGEAKFSFENKVIVEIEVAKGSFQACGFAEVNRGENTIYIDLKPFVDRAHNGC
ncbi:hypothetical protein [Owenweeksia hongkongensis]|uniref:Uncharacterized protein n=1 Tax=Owenweeksia hongkongensis (strain DSM 17368 / CIP 108786 / JCM 12287 / NRRL B-23963 / UST20020801) TaxID=926562 RepID=G8R6A2_OWEHD|nr:hypothetical protein [Owenweeksia hongkongensis]AEV33322.1 hypothetical protein Oweho_2351 [Owenweeksia hongkongensis DSM 17368]